MSVARFTGLLVACAYLVACSAGVHSDLLDDTVDAPLSDAGAWDAVAALDARTSMSEAGARDSGADAGEEMGDATLARDAAVSTAADASGAPNAANEAGATLPVVEPVVADACRGDYVATCDPACMQGQGCASFTCTNPAVYTYPLSPSNVAPFPWRLRTPAVSSAAEACATRCGGTSIATGVMRFELQLPVADDITIKVGAPWRVAIDSRYAFCVLASEAATYASSCVTARMSSGRITLFTTAASAPPRDVIIDVATRTTCGVAP